MSQSAENELLGTGRATIYGDYVAAAISGPSWHIEGSRPGTALCGRPLSGSSSRMRLHVSLLECSRCMSLGEEHVIRPGNSAGGAS